jgi:hypothetical protein
MSNSVFSNGPSRYLKYAALIILVISGLAVAGRGYVAHRRAASDNEIPPVRVDQWNGQQPVASVITLRPTGFEPSALKLPTGRVLIMVENRSGLTEMVLKLLSQSPAGDVPVLLAERPQDDTSKRLQVQVPREKPTWGNVIELTSGQYVLREVNHPDWGCQISVSDR